ncbi:3'(2'),5'-bisphosphate nucleotidase CysQ [Microbacterium amylolyticum]|uniref:3'(2'), 5'-bisphosphate nucleotidase n=1 Tax=Microbacterium amylolyticum TaxID=936337 RepID=A0ABS4ZID3_9MICO|nr:3'(2'),5'-bisphosphate nucleotidase CysQ [Microbacterium amylolyticum]MBP2437045.1 3'(2'), 5'-bisphosphate nucleotidase [Microbacterium amylolyticum]
MSHAQSTPLVGQADAADAGIARSLAVAAATRLLEVRRDNPHLRSQALKDFADRAAQDAIATRLAQLVPSDAVLSEEAPDSDRRLGADRVWIIDPLDGTREFGEGRDDWAVHIALIVRGQLALGAVALGGPEDVLVSSEVAPAPRTPGPIRIAVSRSRPPAVVQSIAAALGAELVPMGSAGVKICAVVRGQADAYVHAGGQYEWDSAAPVAVARAAGLFTSRLDGSDLVYNQPDPYLPDLVVCRPDVRDDVTAAIRAALAE